MWLDGRTNQTGEFHQLQSMTLTMPQRRNWSCTNIFGSQQIRIDTLELAKCHIILERYQVSAADPSAAPNIPRPKWQQQQQSQQQQSLHVRLEEILNLIEPRESVRDDAWHSRWSDDQCSKFSAWNQDLRNESFVQFNFFLSNQGIVNQRWQSFSDRRRCEQYTLRSGTFPAQGHSVTRSRSHALTNFPCVAQAPVFVSRLQGLCETGALCVRKKVICSHCGPHPPLT